MLNYFPKYFTSKAIYLYLGVLVFCNIIFIAHMLSPLWWLFGIIEVIGFFYFSNQLTRKWADLSPKKFTKKLFLTAFIIRLSWVVFSYFFYIAMTGKPFEFGTGDAFGYHNEASWLADMIHNGNIQPYFKYIKDRYSDMGYPFYLGWQYSITGNSILFERFLKVLYGTYMCVLIYKFATRNFGEETGRMSAIFCLLMPNLILYTGMHLKETEMVFLTVWFMERADFVLRSKKYNVINIAAPLALAASLFFFRTVLGAAAMFSFFTALAFSSTSVLGMKRRTVLIIWSIIAVTFFIGGKISTEVEQVWQTRNNNQETSMQWRSERVNGNKFSKYASSAVFAPLIFVIPFPTIVNTPQQENMQLINGGNYVKNILAFFVFFFLYWVIKEKKWREYLLIGSFTFGYLIVISLSAFAQSERFHQPALPFLLVFSAIGISKITNNEKKYFNMYLIIMFVAIVGWSWYKLAGRGMA